MSHYKLTLDNPNQLASIGWDPMLNTFFFHVIDTSKEEDEEGYDVTWAGTTPKELTDLGELHTSVLEYKAGGIPDEMWEQLTVDSD